MTPPPPANPTPANTSPPKAGTPRTPDPRRRARLLAALTLLLALAATALTWRHHPTPLTELTPIPAGMRIDPNTADHATLQLLPGVGPTLATYILNHRDHHGPFTRLAQLDDVPRIGPKTLQRLQPYLTLNQKNTNN